MSKGVFKMALTRNFQQYALHLQEREGFKASTARTFAESMQTFLASGKTALEYAEELQKKNFDWANNFINNYGLYNQYMTTTLFSELHPIRLEARERYLERKGVSA